MKGMYVVTCDGELVCVGETRAALTEPMQWFQKVQGGGPTLTFDIVWQPYRVHPGWFARGGTEG